MIRQFLAHLRFFHVALCIVIAGTFATQKAWAETKLFILNDAIAQTIPISKGLVMASLGTSFTYTSTAILGAYHLSGGKVSAAVAMALWQYSTELASVTGQANAFLKLKGSWKNRAKIQEIANLPGVKKIHIFTSGYSDYAGFYPKALYNQSIVFVEADTEKMPPIFESQWTEITPNSDAKIRMQLWIKGQPIGQSVEIPVHDFIGKADVNPAIKDEWIQKIDAWKKDIPLWQRPFVTKQFSREVGIQGTLLLDGHEQSLGDIAAGKGTQSLLDQGMIATVKNWIRREVIRATQRPAHRFTKEIRVITPEQDRRVKCFLGLKKLLGKVLVRRTPAEIILPTKN
jgi:hypothetical protein